MKEIMLKSPIAFKGPLYYITSTKALRKNFNKIRSLLSKPSKGVVKFLFRSFKRFREHFSLSSSPVASITDLDCLLGLLDG